MRRSYAKFSTAAMMALAAVSPSTQRISARWPSAPRNRFSFSMSKAPACMISKSAPQWLANRLASASTPVNVGENVEATPTCW